MEAVETLKPGDDAPPFRLPSANGGEISLSDFLGKWVVLYFYSKDNTSGCTAEALEFTELKPEFDALNAVIIGISKDSPASHKKFAEQRSLNITLLSDVERKALEAYGAWQLKKTYGKESWGVVRSTVIIDPQGKIARIWPKVAKASGHAAVVLSGFRTLFN